MRHFQSSAILTQVNFLRKKQLSNPAEEPKDSHLKCALKRNHLKHKIKELESQIRHMKELQTASELVNGPVKALQLAVSPKIKF